MPFDPRDNVIHTADGRLIRSTSEADVRRIVAQALASHSPAGIVVNFHGGLVSARDALDTAGNRLYPAYAQGGAYPIFFVWESGFLETPCNELREIGAEPLFREFVKKAGEWALRHLAATTPTARGMRAAAGPRQFRADVDAWFKTGKARRRLPPRLRRWTSGTGRKMVSDTIFPAEKRVRKMVSDTIFRPIDKEALARDIEADIRGDARFQRAAAKAALIDKEARARMFPRRSRAKTGLAIGEWLAVAKAVAEVVVRVLRRVRTGRDHGKYVTIVEEVLRELYVARIGRDAWWDVMKGDTADAFKPGDEHGGTMFLHALRDALAAGTAAPRITLIGHSTGAVYIGHFLESASQWIPDAAFDVIFEAPAATHDFLASVIERHGRRVAGFRSFGLDDAREEADVLVPVVYPASLLYFVSGLLEDEPDQPLTGMQRFLDAGQFDAGRFPNVEACRQFFARYVNGLVWAPRDAPRGCASDARHHQDVDDRDKATLASVTWILQHGFSDNGG